MTDDDRVKRIDGQARTVRQLLDGARYTIDFYQREYAWQERHPKGVAASENLRLRQIRCWRRTGSLTGKARTELRV